MPREPELRRHTDLDAQSISTEGATAPSIYRELGGRSADKVLAEQAV